jgi:SAM-dependent methyltransferase
LSPLVGAHGRVLAEDVVQQTTNRLADRVQRERLDNVAVRLGTPDDPKLPPHSFDRIFLVQVYHEVSSPYAFLWHLREGLKPGGQVIVVESNRPVKRHGMPPTMLRCEFAAVGMDLKQLVPLTNGETYFAAFEATRLRPKPEDITPCREAA